MSDSRVLSSEHARRSGTDKPWEGSNEEWWEWYLSLAAEAPPSPDELVAVDPPPDVAPLPLDALEEELAEPYPLSAVQRHAFARDGYVKLPGFVSPAALASARDEVARLSAAGVDGWVGPGPSGFTSMDMLWQLPDAPVAKAFALSRRIGRAAADLLAVADVRLYHDNLLSKAPACGRTPWHFDAHHFPIAAREIVTSWLPLQAIPAEMGPLAFAVGMDAWQVVDGVDFATAGDSYDRGVAEAFAAAAVPVDDTPFGLGDISFHHAWCFHSARGNATTRAREVVSNTYFADGAAMVDQPTMVSGDFGRFLPGARPGEPIATPMNPVVS